MVWMGVLWWSVIVIFVALNRYNEGSLSYAQAKYHLP